MVINKIKLSTKTTKFTNKRINRRNLRHILHSHLHRLNHLVHDGKLVDGDHVRDAWLQRWNHYGGQHDSLQLESYRQVRLSWNLKSSKLAITFNFFFIKLKSFRVQTCFLPVWTCNVISISGFPLFLDIVSVWIMNSIFKLVLWISLKFKISFWKI